MTIKKVTVNFKNCFGIEKLDHEFDFSKGNTIAIYAQNGIMKTSFAKTFSCIYGGTTKIGNIKDYIFDNQPVEYKVDVDGIEISKDNIFVINSFESKYQSESLSNLLLNDEYKKKLKDIIFRRDVLLKALAEKSGVGIKDIQEIITKDFGEPRKNILEILEDLIKFSSESVFCNIKYTDIFDMIDKINTNDFQDNIKEYIEESKKIFEDSQFSYLSKGNFGFTGLKNIQKSLEKEKFFFLEENKIILAGNQKNKDDFEQEIASIQSKLNQSQGLKKIEKILSRTDKGKILQLCIENNSNIIEYLETAKLGNLRKLLWVDYLKELNIQGSVDDLIGSYNTIKTEIDDTIIDEMPRKKALDIFNDRFTVPFDMEIENKTSVLMGTHTIPKVIFSFYKDGNKDNKHKSNIKTITRDELESVNTLSQGEKRALYLLNIIFDIEKIKQDGIPKIVIIDDIADSFDYKNKYAIIEYLREMQEYNDSNNEKVFYQIVLSHNFDFYRTVSSRLNLKRDNKFHVEKSSNSEISLCKEMYQGNPFETWKEIMKPCRHYDIIYDINDSKKHIIALIPFVRNLIQFGDNNFECFITLTHLLHQKNLIDYNNNGKPLLNNPSTTKTFEVKKTEDIVFGDLKPIYLKYIGKDDFDVSIENIKVYDGILNFANTITITDTKLENKIILAIAIRLVSEKHMINQINNQNDIDKIEGNQTWSLFKEYTGSDNNKKILNSVNIITPENIHLNSFMYEPILDMGIDELKILYQKVCTLS